jgi:hypothetical protein
MATKDKPSTSINNPRLSELESTTNLGILEAQEEPLICRSGAPTLDGGNCSDTKEDSSLTCGIIESLTFLEEKMLKLKRLLFGRDTVAETRNGRCNMLTKQRMLKRRDLLVTSVSMPTDHSTSDQDSQCKESWSASEPIISLLEDGERIHWHNNGTSTQFQRLSDLSNGPTEPSKSRAMVEVQTLG